MKRWQTWVGILISAVFLYFAFKGMHLKEVWEAIKTARLIWLLPGMAVYFLAVYMRAWRWHYLLRALKDIATRKMFPIVAIGYMGNNIYPARAGEVLRAVILKNREEVPISASLATIIVERIFDGVVMLGFVFLNLGALTHLTHSSGFIGNIRQLAVWGAVIFLIALGVFLAAAMLPYQTERMVQWFIQKLIPAKLQKKTEDIAFKFIHGLEALRSPKDAFMVFFTTVIIWLLETGKYWFVMHAFDFQVSFFALMLMNGIVNLATTIPSAPGYIGTFDLPGIAVLAAYGVSKEIASAYTYVLHAALWFPITILGAWYYFKQPLRWGKTVTQQSLEETTNDLSKPQAAEHTPSAQEKA